MSSTIWTSFFGTRDDPEDLNGPSNLSEDACGDLVHSLVRLGYLSNIVTSLDGKSFITHEQLAKDIMNQLEKSNDRVGGVIIGQWDTVDRGLVIEPRFLEKEKATLLKALDDLKEPTNLQSLRSRHIVEDQLFYGLCDLLSKESAELPGMFRGTNDQGIFAPHSYGKQQTEWIETFLKDNGFIELDSIKKRGVSDPKAYLQLHHPRALVLEIHAVKESIWSMVDATIEDTIANLSWVDVKPLLPTPLTKGDLSSLLLQLPSLAEPTSRIAISPDQDHSLTGLGGGSPQETFIIQDSIVVTSAQLQKCILKMGPLLDRSLKALVSWRLSFGESERLENDGDFDNDEDDLDVYGEHGDNLKGLMEHALGAHNQQRKTGRSKSSQNIGKGDGKKRKKEKKQIQDFMTIQDVKEEIRQLEPDFDSALVNATAGVLYRGLVQNLKDRNRSVVLNQMQEEEEEEENHEIRGVESEQETKEQLGIKHLPSTIRSLVKRIELSSESIDVFDDTAVKNSLSKYLLQSWCVELLDLVILYLTGLDKMSTNTSPEALGTRQRLEISYAEHCDQTNTVSGSGSGRKGPFVISTDDSAILLKLVSQDMTDHLRKMRKLTAGSCKQKSLIEYLDICSTLTKDLKLELETFETTTKDNSQLLTEHMKELNQVLTGIQPFADTALMLHTVTLIAFQRWTGSMLHASGKFVPRILRQLRLTVEQQPELKQAVEPQLRSLEKMMDFVLSNVKQQQSEIGEQESNQQTPDQMWQSVYDIGASLSTSI
ncbi:E3 UFM1-protein ligase 1 [Mortierella sp. AM989]|nr:E3 UFM1-protein ligase 1 [Mortierella sp. AM989]